MDAPFRQRLQTLRKRCGLSIRQLAQASGVTAPMISMIERGKASPSLATLQKILAALGSDLGRFFAGGGEDGVGPLYRRERMTQISDGERNYTILLPRREGIRVEMFDEEISPTRRRPEFEVLECDVAGYVLSGELILEVGRERLTIRPGDAFYIRSGTRHRGYAVGTESVRLVTTYSPPRY